MPATPGAGRAANIIGHPSARSISMECPSWIGRRHEVHDQWSRQLRRDLRVARELRDYYRDLKHRLDGELWRSGMERERWRCKALLAEARR